MCTGVMALCACSMQYRRQLTRDDTQDLRTCQGVLSYLQSMIQPWNRTVSAHKHVGCDKWFDLKRYAWEPAPCQSDRPPHSTSRLHPCWSRYRATGRRGLLAQTHKPLGQLSAATLACSASGVPRAVARAGASSAAPSSATTSEQPQQLTPPGDNATVTLPPPLPACYSHCQPRRLTS